MRLYPMWLYREPRYVLSWLASQPRIKQIGRIALFALALRHAGYSTLGMSPVTGPEIFYWTVYFYPALLVLWGLWKAQAAIGWSVLWFMGLNITGIIVLTMDKPDFVSPVHDWDTFALFLWGLAPFELATFLIIYAVWFWDRRLPATGGQLPRPPAVSRAYHTVRSLLLGGTVLCFCLGLGLWLWFQAWANPADLALKDPAVPTWRWLRLLTPENYQDLSFALFHMVSLLTLATLLFYGLWRRRNDVIEAGLALLGPGQAITVAWSPRQPVLIATTLVLLLLCLLALWHQGFPMALCQTRRSRGHRENPALDLTADDGS